IGHSQERPYTIVVHMDNTMEGRAAAEYACGLCTKLKVKYRLIIVFVIALYSKTKVGF
ncbi:hypothetical protein EV182_005692, partial [Spiromyces aspiralis]